MKKSSKPHKGGFVSQHGCVPAESGQHVDTMNAFVDKDHTKN